MKSAIEISFLVGTGVFATGLWMLAPWLALTVGGLMIMLGAGVAYFNEPAKKPTKTS